MRTSASITSRMTRSAVGYEDVFVVLDDGMNVVIEGTDHRLHFVIDIRMPNFLAKLCQQFLDALFAHGYYPRRRIPIALRI
jgi:hypothetical protein